LTLLTNVSALADRSLLGLPVTIFARGPSISASCSWTPRAAFGHPDDLDPAPWVQQEGKYERNLGPQVRDASGIAIEKARRMLGYDPQRSWRDYLDEDGKAEPGIG